MFAAVDDVQNASPAGPWTRRVHRINEAVFEGMETVDQLTRKAVQQYANEVCFGWREAFGEEEEEQPDGKVFKKVSECRRPQFSEAPAGLVARFPPKLSP